MTAPAALDRPSLADRTFDTVIGAVGAGERQVARRADGVGELAAKGIVGTLFAADHLHEDLRSRLFEPGHPAAPLGVRLLYAATQPALAAFVGLATGSALGRIRAMPEPGEAPRPVTSLVATWLGASLGATAGLAGGLRDAYLVLAGRESEASEAQSAA